MDRRKASNSQAGRKRRRKLTNNSNDDEQSAVDLIDEEQQAQSGGQQQRQWNVIDRVLDASKYESGSSDSLYRLCRGWICAGTTLTETAWLSENAVQEKAKFAALAASNEVANSSPNEQSK